MLQVIPRFASLLPQRPWYRDTDIVAIDGSMLKGTVLETPTGNFGTTDVQPTTLANQSQFKTALSISGASYRQNIRMPGNIANYLPRSGNWVIDFWMLDVSTARPAFCPIMSASTRSQGNRLEMGAWDGDSASFVIWNNAASPIVTIGNYRRTPLAWRHIAVQRQSNSVRLYNNGVLLGSRGYSQGATTGTVTVLSKLTASAVAIDRYRIRQAVVFSGNSFPLESLYTGEI